MRDKLESLMLDYEQEYNSFVFDRGRLADYLIANGVTFAEDNNVPTKWIPVSERLPTADDADRIGRVWAVHKGELPKAWHYTLIQDYAKFFTHWMPLPEPPEEGE